MNRLAKKLALVLYLAVIGALLVDYLMGFGWFGRYDKIAVWVFVTFAGLFGNWRRARAEKAASSGEAIVEALDADGAVRSDPRARRFVWQTVLIVVAVTILVILALAYRDRNRRDPSEYASVALVAVIVTLVVCYKQFGNVGDVEGDDGVTLTLSRRGRIIRVPWRQVESVEVSRPYSFWRVTIKFRYLGESAAQTIQFLPLGWRKMTPTIAEKLRFALERRRLAQ